MKRCPYDDSHGPFDDSMQTCPYDHEPLYLDLAGTRLGDNTEIKYRIGGGGMAHVYYADHRIGTALVPRAVKVMNEEVSRSPGAIKKFEKEAGNQALVKHVNNVEVYDFGFIPHYNLYYISMEYAHGADLQKIMYKKDERSGQIIRRPIPPQKCLQIIEQIAAGVDKAHSRGVLHLDLKPSNIIVNGLETANPEVKITDWGISKIKKEDSLPERTKANVVEGSVPYMSPEHYSPEKGLLPQSDVFSLGIILYEMLSCHRPYGDNNTIISQVAKVQNEKFVNLMNVVPPGLRRVLPPSVWNVIRKSLRVEPHMRYPSAGELAQSFREALKIRVKPVGDMYPLILAITIFVCFGIGLLIGWKL